MSSLTYSAVGDGEGARDAGRRRHGRDLLWCQTKRIMYCIAASARPGAIATACTLKTTRNSNAVPEKQGSEIGRSSRYDAPWFLSNMADVQRSIMTMLKLPTR
jgi:hypothetical protein